MEETNQHPELLCSLDVLSDRSFHVGKGLALFLQGWAFHPGISIERLYMPRKLAKTTKRMSRSSTSVIESALLELSLRRRSTLNVEGVLI